MPQKDVEAIIRKAVQDDVFRLSLERDIEGTISEHKLQVTGEELAALKTVDWTKSLPTPKDLAAGTWVHVYKTNAGI